MNKREEILKTAMDLVTGERNVSYGDPNVDFSRTAVMWNLLIKERTELSSSDVALMMVLLKCSRQINSPKEDNWIDIAGYAACGADCDDHANFQKDLEKTKEKYLDQKLSSYKAPAYVDAPPLPEYISEYLKAAGQYVKEQVNPTTPKHIPWNEYIYGTRKIGIDDVTKILKSDYDEDK